MSDRIIRSHRGEHWINVAAPKPITEQRTVARLELHGYGPDGEDLGTFTLHNVRLREEIRMKQNGPETAELIPGQLSAVSNREFEVDLHVAADSYELEYPIIDEVTNWSQS